MKNINTIILLASISVAASGLVSCSTPMPNSASGSAATKVAGLIDEDALDEDVKIFHSRKNHLKVNGERVAAERLLPYLGEIDRKEPIGSIGYYLEDGANVSPGSPVASNVKEFATSHGIKLF